jgi:PAS domain S-box-containing protein
VPSPRQNPTRSSGELSRLLFEGNACPMWICDAESSAFLEVNAAAAALYGYSRDELLSMTLKDIHPAEHAPRRLSTGTWRHRQKNGSVMDVEVTANRIEWDGRPAHLATVRDVSRQAKTEKALRESEERFNLISRATNDVVWDWDLIADTSWWNAGITTVFGYAPKDVGPGSDWWMERVHPDDKEMVLAATQRTIETAETFCAEEYRFRRADGTYALVRDRGYVLRDADGKAVRMIGAMMDITPHREAEKALRENQELMRQMNQAIQDVFYVSDAETNDILYMNAAFERIWGVSVDAVRGRPRSWLDSVHPDDRERVVRSLAEWQPRGEAPEWNEEFRIIRPDGAVRWIWIRSFPIRDASGEIVRFAGVERDVTERKRTEDTVRSLLAITRQLNSTLDVDALMEALVKETLRLLDAEGGFAGLLTPEGMTCLKYFTQTDAIPFTYRWPSGRGLPGWVAEHGAPYVTNDAAADPQICRDIQERFSIRSALCMPLLDPHSKVLGFIQTHNKKDGSGFDHWDEEMLTAVSRAASVGVQNALAYHKLQETAEALRRAEEKYRGIFENAVEGIGRTTPGGQILAANPALARMLGYDSPEDLIANVSDIGRIYVDKGLRAEMERMMEREGAIQGVEAQVHRKDGTPIWLLMNLRAVRDEQGRLQHYDGVAQDVTARKKTEETLREVSGLLLQTQNVERRRIARELHDSTAQSLAALGMNLSMVGKAAGRLSQAARKKLLDSIELTQQCCREVRTLSYLLHPPALEEGDLWSAVRWYTEGFANRSGIRVDLTLPRAQRAGRLPEVVETTLFRIVQESLANIHRHSGSRRARIRIAKSRSRVTLLVRDDGRGLRKVVGSHTGAPALMGVGIAGMRERVRQLGGEIVIDSSGRGTEVKVMLPLSKGH